MVYDEGNGRRRAIFAAAAQEPGPDPTCDVGAAEAKGGLRLRPRVVERTAIIRLAETATLIEEDEARRVEEQLMVLVREAGHSRLVINFSGVKYACRRLLIALAGLAVEIRPRGGWVGICGLTPLIVDLLGSLDLGTALDVCEDEAQALGLLIR